MKKVLLIEDDTSLRKNIEELLDLSGFTVFTLSNGKTAAALAEKECPDIVLCDIMMPEADGYEVLAQLSSNQSTRHIPFIFISAKTEHYEVRKGMNLGADDYLTKPFDEEELLSAIHSRLEKAQQRQSLLAVQEEMSHKEDDIRSLNELKNFFDDNGRQIFLKKGEALYTIGEHSNTIYLILKGVVKCCVLDENGKELITAIYAEDDFLGFTSLTENIPHQEYAIALEDVELAGISKTQVKAILEKNQKVSLELMNIMVENVTQIKKQLLQMAYGSVRKKTAQTLLHYAKVTHKEKENLLNITRGNLAGVAGVATESLIRTLSDFKNEGLIAIENRNIRVLDKEALKYVH